MNCMLGISLIFAFYTYSDVNECSAADQLCDTNANCTNTQGSFYCSCSTGFTPPPPPKPQIKYSQLVQIGKGV